MTVEEDFVELEMDALNKHECMANMLAVIRHMHEKHITPPVPEVNSFFYTLL